ncbi:DCP1 (YOL149W) [Zygosaccharomyces parabailii]|nr:DCP1 (YOL149W) [Zygosaccharomyces parabailii]CDH09510.1 probable DCP1-mRNA decapping enzyme [Zygosaccharomyces bailii ISA1307]
MSTDETAASEMTMEFYRKALNFNVIGRYDPKIKQLLFHTPHASLYKWEFDKDEWTKLECQGVFAIYLRDVSNKDDMLPDLETQEQSVTALASQANGEGSISGAVLSGCDIYNYGLIILNRINPDNFSMGIVPNSVVNKRKVFDAPKNMENPLECMGVEVKDELVIIKNLKHEVYGVWIHTAADRQNIYELIKYLLENDPKDSFA